MDYLAGVLGCGRIQIFLDLHPEKSGFLRFPDLLVRMSRKPPASRTCWFACHGSRRLPGLAGSHVAEAAGFPDLLVRVELWRRVFPNSPLLSSELSTNSGASRCKQRDCPSRG